MVLSTCPPACSMQVALAILNVHFTLTQWQRETNTIYRLLEHSEIATYLAKKNRRQCWKGIIFYWQDSTDAKKKLTSRQLLFTLLTLQAQKRIITMLQSSLERVGGIWMCMGSKIKKPVVQHSLLLMLGKPHRVIWKPGTIEAEFTSRAQYKGTSI